MKPRKTGNALNAELLLNRGSGLLRRARAEKRSGAVPSRIAEHFITRNARGAVRVFVAGGSRPGNKKIYADQAELLGHEIGKRNYRLDFGLSSNGLMGAVARGVLHEWAIQGRRSSFPVQGVTTKEYLALYRTQKILSEVSDIIVAKTLEERKRQLLNADFVIFAPGGVGTLDELVYDCVAMQDGFLQFKPFVLFNVDGFFHHLLEFLKDIHLQGFADAVPFIVVDDSAEAGLAFDLIGLSGAHGLTKDKARAAVEKIIYELPYVIAQRRLFPHKSAADIVAEKDAVLAGRDTEARKRLAQEIETCYLNKEMERMYARLEHTGRDTAIVSSKLTSLKKRRKV
ncbi:MAG: LOG family protein [Alphaproteobacteria bacterium]|nr:LOG family protein [Alphaproteobacteria bacterium]